MRNLDHRIATLVWEPAIPPALIVLIGLVLAALTVRVYSAGRQKGLLSGRQRFFLMALRLIAVAGICAILFQPMIETSKARRISKRVALVGVDNSKSMTERDGTEQSTRLDTARRLLAESGLAGSGGAEESEIGELRFFQFDESATPLVAQQLPALEATGETTAFHQSVSSILGELESGENGVGLFLFSDGHDFEMVSAKRTGQIARSKQVPIYPVALGKEQLVPDLSVNIASYQPHTFIKQMVRIQATMRLLGSQPRQLQVDLIREGELLRSRKLLVEAGQDVPVAFEVGEDAPGQYEYQIRVSPLPGEREVHNNSAYTFLNVSDAKIPVLLIEGAPHWDSTFMRRTLSRNARIELTTVVSMGTAGLKTFAPDGKAEPSLQSEADFRQFPLIILGRDCDRVLDAAACLNLAQAIENGGGSLVFARGNPGDHEVFEELAPAQWADGEATGPVRVVRGKRAGQIVPLEVLATGPGGGESLPELPIAQGIGEPKTLAAVEAVAEASDDNQTSPAFVHRRHGRGQVLAVAVGGMWKWSLNPNSESSNNVYDRFWNQLILNLIAQSGGSLNNKSSITMSSANISVGERVNFALNLVPGTAPPVSPRITIFRDEELVTEVPLAQSAQGEGPFTGSMLADKTGRYRGLLKLGSDELQCRFAVYQERRETTETSVDLPYLRSLAAASGGRLLDPGGLKKAIAELARAAEAESNAPPIITRRTLWDRAGIFYLLFLLLGLEWALRRRWGLT